jgi:DNA helicase-2/ATP-dependent DNA helicase PcrA
MESLLAPLADLLSGGDAKGRLAATKRIEKFVLSQFEWSSAESAIPDREEPASREEQLERLGATSDQLRMVVSTLSTSAMTWTDGSLCSAGVRSTIEAFAAPFKLGLVPSLRARLRIPPKVWAFWTSRTKSLLVNAADEAIRWGHIHGVKGDEFDAVILVLPSATRPGARHVLDDWQSDDNTEQRRVLYVGVSRAKRVLVLVVPKSRRTQLETLLARAGVAFTVSFAN